MRTYEVSACIIRACHGRDWTEADDYLYAAGRAVTWVLMAADAVQTAQELKVAEYHAYTGISAARSAVDATANWHRVRFLPSEKPGTSIDLAKEGFREKLKSLVPPSVFACLETLGHLARDELDVWRQRAQHREGVQPILREGGAWYVALLGYASPHTEQWHLASLLKGWADSIERQLCAILDDPKAVTVQL
ncbi:MAG: hypothetical protein ACRDJE_07930 [Dehalococcoidia bacterium]